MLSSSPINEKVPVCFLLAFHRWRQERPLPPSLALPQPFSDIFLSHFYSTPRSLRNDQRLRLSSNITLQIFFCSHLLSACLLTSRAPWLYLQRVYDWMFTPLQDFIELDPQNRTALSCMILCKLTLQRHVVFKIQQHMAFTWYSTTTTHGIHVVFKWHSFAPLGFPRQKNPFLVSVC